MAMFIAFQVGIAILQTIYAVYGALAGASAVGIRCKIKRNL
jgi:hypothetical protein